ncbi:MAG: D-alanyl-D-alanine carboxypeptidase family protein [Firmicutes bacterium]|nr:D-alanyl-D-alanine carboxypeptidase family protein [Bacillota bacterium]
MKNNKLENFTCIMVIILILLFFYDDNDEEFYTNIKEIKEPNNITVLVNKNNILPKTYIPNDLRLINNRYAYSNKYLREEAAINFENLSADAKVLGYRIIATSAFRDYEYQEKLFNEYTNSKGLEYALLCSAKPGHSEHQTGLAVDVEGSNKDYDEFEKSIEFNWMKENAHKYGFILRYPKGKEYITGFKYEPWHYRYVGIKHATNIYNQNITLEEYKKRLNN